MPRTRASFTVIIFYSKYAYRAVWNKMIIFNLIMNNYCPAIFIVMIALVSAQSIEQSCTVSLHKNKCDDDLRVTYCSSTCFNNYNIYFSNASMKYSCTSHEYANITVFQEPNCTGWNKTYTVLYTLNESTCMKISGQNWTAAPWSRYCPPPFPSSSSSSPNDTLYAFLILIGFVVFIALSIYFCQRYKRRNRQGYHRITYQTCQVY